MLKKRFNNEVELIPSGGGAFEVAVNDSTVFSKLGEGRFPGEGEVEKKIEQLFKK